jgi:GH24 family phage-related lysozyme (muramidase)
MCGDMRVSCQQPCETNDVNSEIQDFEALLDVLKEVVQFLIDQTTGGDGNGCGCTGSGAGNGVASGNDAMRLMAGSTNAQSAAHGTSGSQSGQSASKMKISQKGVDFVKSKEGGPYLKAYNDGAGVWTIGYGHTANVRPGQTITASQAEAFLRSDLQTAEAAVRKYVKVPLTQGQYDALVSFTYNLGAGALKESKLLKDLNKGDYAAAQKDFGNYIYANHKVFPGLVKRRREEAAMFGNQAPAKTGSNTSTTSGSTSIGPVNGQAASYAPYTVYSSSATQVKKIGDANQLLPHHDRTTSVRNGQTLELRDVVLTHPGQSNNGQKIPSPVSGKVISAGKMGTAGNAVIIKADDGSLVYLFHMSKINVKEGQHVAYGQTVGLQGSTGHSTGPHVHIEAKPAIIDRWVDDLIDGKFDGIDRA